MLRAILVGIHTAAGVGGLLTGVWSLRPPQPTQTRRWFRRLYWLCIVALLVSVVVLVAVDWSDFDAGARVAFVALAGGLGGAMLYRLARADREARTRTPGWEKRYIGHVYFTYVSLWIGFVVLPALNLPLPQVTVPATAVAVLAIGTVLINRYKRRVLGA